MTDFDLKTAVNVMQWLVTGGVALYAHVTARAAATAADVTKVSERVTALEAQLRHLPDHNLVAGLAGDMKAVKAELQAMQKAMTEAISPLARSVDRINEHLLTRK
ncbi:hypothetical protein ANDA3_3753 [plant metagenome]|uniref:DUF2730 family protein n=1 Tax=plant metagenome TaxID=1297885 RepID=A0A484T5J8_9ZZZZ